MAYAQIFKIKKMIFIISKIMSLSDFCIPANKMEFSLKRNESSHELLQEFLKDQKVLVNLMKDMKTTMYGKSVLITSDSISERVKTILEQNGYNVCPIEHPYHAKGWTRVTW